VSIVLRPYRDADLEIVINLWRRAWDAAMPEINFGDRLDWWRERWTGALLPQNIVTIAETDDRMIGFVVIDSNSGYLDQIVVDPSSWGSGVAKKLLAEARKISPNNVTLDVNQSNLRAISFYEREGFVRTGEGNNPISGKSTWRYEWKPR
jgi:putative acetyltransferase